MFIFRFNKEANRIMVSKMKEGTEPILLSSLYTPIMRVELDPNGGILSKRIEIHQKEGFVYRRTFWLSEYDEKRALDIIYDYKKLKWIEATENLEKMEEDLHKPVKIKKESVLEKKWQAFIDQVNDKAATEEELETLTKAMDLIRKYESV